MQCSSDVGFWHSEFMTADSTHFISDLALWQWRSLDEFPLIATAIDISSVFRFHERRLFPFNFWNGFMAVAIAGDDGSDRCGH